MQDQVVRNDRMIPRYGRGGGAAFVAYFKELLL
jgi:hypothetical protein